jgi:Domain of unknown function (DUF4149)
MFLRFVSLLRVFMLGAWVGAILYFAAIVTRGAFAVLSNRDEAGLLVGFTLSGLHVFGFVCATIFLIASIFLAKSLNGLVRRAALSVIVMAVLTAASQFYVMPRMTVLRMQMGSVEATESSDPRRAEFDKLHSASVGVEGAVLVIGLVALFLAARERES